MAAIPSGIPYENKKGEPTHSADSLSLKLRFRPDDYASITWRVSMISKHRFNDFNSFSTVRIDGLA